jgi:hypothetical protein
MAPWQPRLELTHRRRAAARAIYSALSSKSKRKFDLGHIVVGHRYSAPVIPLDRDSAPSHFDDGAEISGDLVPAHAITHPELPRLFAGHWSPQRKLVLIVIFDVVAADHVIISNNLFDENESDSQAG